MRGKTARKTRGVSDKEKAGIVWLVGWAVVNICEKYLLLLLLSINPFYVY